MSASIEHKHLAPTFPLAVVAKSLVPDQIPEHAGIASPPALVHANAGVVEPLVAAAATTSGGHATIKTAIHANMKRSPMNVRKRATDVTELAALIRTQGLLQNLVGYRQRVGGIETEIVEVVAGGRRLEAIGILIEDGTLPDDFGIPYLLVTEDEAMEMSMAENRGRENMHPADVYEAMLELTARGRTVEDIAISFNLETLTVKRCLKLANASPRLLELFRNDEANFEQMMALAISDSHSAQEHAWDSLSKHSRSAYELRRLLTARQVNVQTDRLARFVGVAAFEKAGGQVLRDLFSDSGAGYISDVTLLEKLVAEKLEKHRRKLMKEGLAWVEILPRADRSTLAEYGRVRTTLSELTAEQAAQIVELNAKLEQLQGQIDATDEDDACDELQARAHALAGERRSILQQRSMVVNAEDRALAGAVVTLDEGGNVFVERDLIRPADKSKMAKLPDGADRASPAKRAKAVHSDRLTHILTSQRTVALQAELMDRPDMALLMLTSALISKIAPAHRGFVSICKTGLTQASLAEEAKESPAGSAFAARHQEILAQLPKRLDGGSLLVWMHHQPTSVVIKLMAFCVASSLDATQSREGPCSAFHELADLMELDMTKWWKASAANYFNHVSRDRTLAVVAQAVSPEAAVPLEKMKKAEAALAAERALSATSWLPEPLQAE